MAAHDDDFERRFPVFWGMLTVTYAAAVAYRALTQSHLPGLPTFAALSAITAVWLSFVEQVRSRPHLQRAIILTTSANRP